MSIFTKRHYEAVAKHMREVKAVRLVTVSEHTMDVWKETVKELGRMFRWDNDKFQYNKFANACGMDD